MPRKKSIRFGYLLSILFTFISQHTLAQSWPRYVVNEDDTLVLKITVYDYLEATPLPGVRGIVTLQNQPPDTLLTDATGRLLRLATSVHSQPEFGSSLPNDFILEPNYPNPFSNVTNIDVMAPAETRIVVYNIMGRRVNTFGATDVRPGESKYSFDFSNLSTGLYLIRMGDNVRKVMHLNDGFVSGPGRVEVNEISYNPVLSQQNNVANGYDHDYKVLKKFGSGNNIEQVIELILKLEKGGYDVASKLIMPPSELNRDPYCSWALCSSSRTNPDAPSCNREELNNPITLPFPVNISALGLVMMLSPLACP